MMVTLASPVLAKLAPWMLKQVQHDGVGVRG